MRQWVCASVYWTSSLVTKKTDFLMTVFIPSHIWYLYYVMLLYPWLCDISLLHLSRASCILCMPDSLIYKMPPCGAIFYYTLPTLYFNGCRLHIPLANIFETKKWSTSFTCTIFNLAVEEVVWNPILPILHKQPIPLRCLWLISACMLENSAFSSTVMFGILSCQVIPRILKQRRWN